MYKPTYPRRLDSGAEVTRSDCEAFDIAGEEYENGTKSFKFRRNIYSHPSVRQLLKRAHYRKCCFCEGKSNAFAPGDVEHYRPKGAVRQAENSIVLLPGYFWLAYSWENLYWCCQICNRSNKRDFSPLEMLINALVQILITSRRRILSLLIQEAPTTRATILSFDASSQ